MDIANVLITEWRFIMTSKQRTELKSQAMKLDSIFQIGKSSLTPQSIDAIRAALKARELIKINVLKNCDDDTNELAKIIAERTGAEVVQVIGKKRDANVDHTYTYELNYIIDRKNNTYTLYSAYKDGIKMNAVEELILKIKAFDLCDVDIK